MLCELLSFRAFDFVAMFGMEKRFWPFMDHLSAQYEYEAGANEPLIPCNIQYFV